MKKRLLYFFLLILFLFLGWQLFKYRQSGGNTIFWVNNWVHADNTTEINIYVDDKMIAYDSLNERTQPKAPLSIKTSFGRHKLTVDLPKLGFRKDYIFYSIAMKWIYISFGRDFSKPPGDPNEFKIIIQASSVPLAIE